MKKNVIYFFVVSIFVFSCISPRNITQSGKATPKGNFSVGYNMSGNIPTQTMDDISEVLNETVDELENNGPVHFNPDIEMINKAALSYSLDPLNVGSDFYIRYGLMKRIDLGFKISGGAKAIDFHYQFLGPLGNIENETSEKFYGSLGFQFSSQNQELPSILGDLQTRLGYQFSKKDVIIPLTFSYSLGNEEKYGAVAFGAALNYSKIKFSLMPANILTSDNLQIMGIENNQHYFSYGAFVNCKIGYKYIFLIPAISVFRQNYGSFKLLGGNIVNLKGWTIIPSIGINLRLGKSFSKL